MKMADMSSPSPTDPKPCRWRAAMRTNSEACRQSGFQSGRLTEGVVMKHAQASLMALGLIVALAGPAAAQTAEPWRAHVAAFAAENLKHPAWGLSHSQRDYAL